MSNKKTTGWIYYRLLPENCFVLWCPLVVSVCQNNGEEEGLLLVVRPHINLVHYFMILRGNCI